MNTSIAKQDVKLFLVRHNPYARLCTLIWTASPESARLYLHTPEQKDWIQDHSLHLKARRITDAAASIAQRLRSFPAAGQERDCCRTPARKDSSKTTSSSSTSTGECSHKYVQQQNSKNISIHFNLITMKLISFASASLIILRLEAGAAENDQVRTC